MFELERSALWTKFARESRTSDIRWLAIRLCTPLVSQRHCPEPASQSMSIYPDCVILASIVIAGCQHSTITAHTFPNKSFEALRVSPGRFVHMPLKTARRRSCAVWEEGGGKVETRLGIDIMQGWRAWRVDHVCDMSNCHRIWSLPLTVIEMEPLSGSRSLCG